MRRRRRLTATAAVILTLTGCATVQTNKEWARVGDFSKERTGHEVRWEQTAEDAQATKAEVTALLADGLTRDEAVRIALMNNRTLQAAFEELGVAKADLVQAGLFTNPRIDGLVRFPTEGGGTNVEAGGLINIADLWQIPVRKRLSATRLEATTLQVTNELLDTVAGAKKAYDDAVALTAARDVAAQLRKELETLRDRLAYRREYGFTSDFDLAFARAAVLDQEAALARIEGELKVARTGLDRILGLSVEQRDYDLSGSLPEDLGPLPETDTLVAHAMVKRPDVQMAELDITISERALALERARVLTEVEAGASFERDLGKENLVGPALGIQLPLFDQNQAQIAKATFRVRQAEKRRRALEGKVREEVSAALEQYDVALKESRLIRDQVIPAYQSALEYADKYYSAMQLNMLFLLEARKELSASRRRHITSLREALMAKVDVERALGGTIPTVKEPSR